MAYGAGMIAAWNNDASEIIDPRPFTVNSITATFIKYPMIGRLLPAMGYGEEQVRDLETTINNTDCDSVIIATPVDLGRILKINKPSVRVKYELKEISPVTIKSVLLEKGII
jgi:predicted GTPase